MKTPLVARFYIGVWIFIWLFFRIFCQTAQASSWPYDPLYQPITRQEILYVFRDPKSSFRTKRSTLSRAGVNGLLEVIVVECSNQLKSHPRDPILRSFYCYALFIAHDPAEYKPQNKKEWLRQQKILFVDAELQAESIIEKEGAGISFCWQSLAYINLTGIAGGVPKGIERAERALELSPRDPFAQRLLSSAYLSSGPTQDLSKALKYAEQATIFQPNFSRPYSYQAQALFLQKKYAAALRALQKSYALRPPEYRDKKFFAMYQSWAKYQTPKNKS